MNYVALNILTLETIGRDEIKYLVVEVKSIRGSPEAKKEVFFYNGLPLPVTA